MIPWRYILSIDFMCRQVIRQWVNPQINKLRTIITLSKNIALKIYYQIMCDHEYSGVRKLAEKNKLCHMNYDYFLD